MTETFWWNSPAQKPWHGEWVSPDLEFSGNGTDTLEFAQIKAFNERKQRESEQRHSQNAVRIRACIEAAKEVK
jgi:hypothetical protein